MDSVSNVLKVLVILSALLVLRVLIQAALRRQGVQAGIRHALPFLVPPLVCGGPMALALAAAFGSADAAASAVFAMVGFAGAVALAVGLVAMHTMIQNQQREIARLREALIPAGGDRA